MSAIYLAGLNQWLQQALNNVKPFGGLYVFLVGDFAQNEAIGGTSIPRAVMQLVDHEKRISVSRESSLGQRKPHLIKN